MCGARVRDQFTREEWDVHAKCVINATGPYTDDIRRMDDASRPNICQPSAGVHIVLPEYYRYDSGCRIGLILGGKVKSNTTAKKSVSNEQNCKV